MKSFLLSSLPLLLVGLAVAILCARMSGLREEKEQRLDRRAAAGLLWGLAGGVLLYSFGLCRPGLCFSIAPLWGMSLTVLLPCGSRARKK